MRDQSKFSVIRFLGHSLFFTLLYTLFFLVITNAVYWYFNKRFLYAELFSDQGYYMFEWVSNLIATVIMAVCVLIIEMTRYLVGRRRRT